MLCGGEEDTGQTPGTEGDTGPACVNFFFPCPQSFSDIFSGNFRFFFYSTMVRNKEKYGSFKDKSPYELLCDSSPVPSKLHLLLGCPVQSQPIDGLCALLKGIFRD